MRHGAYGWATLIFIVAIASAWLAYRRLRLIRAASASNSRN